MIKPLIVWIAANYGNFVKKWEYQTTLTVSWETYMQDKEHHIEPDMERWTSSKLGKEYIKIVYCHPAYLTYIQNTYKLNKQESRLPRKISTASDLQMIPF